MNYSLLFPSPIMRKFHKWKEFGGLEVHFKVDGEVLTVTGIDRR